MPTLRRKRPPARPYGVPLTDEERAAAQDAFLSAFRETGVVRYGADAAGVSRNTILDWRTRYPDFGARYQEALDDADDVVRAEIHRRGVEGWLEPVYQGGKKVGTIRRYSDNILKLLAQSRMSEYRDRVDVTSAGQPLGSYEHIAELAADGEASQLVEQALDRLAGPGLATGGPGVAGE